MVWRREDGPISPLLCNIYLHRLDKALTRGAGCWCVTPTILWSAAAAPARWRRRSEQWSRRWRGSSCAVRRPRRGAVSFFDGFEFLGARFERETVQVLWEERLYRLDEATPDFGCGSTCPWAIDGMMGDANAVCGG